MKNIINNLNQKLEEFNRKQKQNRINQFHRLEDIQNLKKEISQLKENINKEIETNYLLIEANKKANKENKRLMAIIGTSRTIKEARDSLKELVEENKSSLDKIKKELEKR